MTKYIYLIATTMFLFACDIQNEAENKRIKELEQKLRITKDSLTDIKIRYKDILRNQENFRDSVIFLKQKLKQSSSVLNYLPIDYKQTVKDEYWKRGEFYTSKNEGEIYCNVKVSELNGKMYFYFLGIQNYSKNNFNVALYELDELKQIIVIDTFKIPSKGAYFDHHTEERHLDDSLLKQLDNIIIKGNDVYYYKLNADRKKEFYVYKINSKKKSERVYDNILSDVYFNEGYPMRAFFNYNNSIVAITDAYSIDFRYRQFESFSFNKLNKLKKIDFNFNSFFTVDNDYIIDNDSDKKLFFGGLDWHNTKNILYFDNSGFNYRCIWEADLEKKQVIKIVPEHEAIHPFFINEKYIAYIQNNKIMICESPHVN
ncbi:hypothetical protein [Cellulophaga sp. L1A9]|uniref:hypothetical protein n=1 Tax=Cellulophaga sp. L1A9 TaxID=2686362 RepID=UPI00131E21B9|nr:hypothetical protein [Cellulophaga sp. L1A9]